jgi:hypothetical protein
MLATDLNRLTEIEPTTAPNQPRIEVEVMRPPVPSVWRIDDMTLQLVLQTATPVSVIVGFVSLIYTINNYRRQATMQVLMKYTERYEHILDQLPQDALEARFDATVLPPQSAQLKLCVLKYLNLCSEEYYLREHGYLAKSVWRIWEGDLRRIIGSPLCQREWLPLRTEFVSHPDFLEYVERIQAEYRTANAQHA